MTTIRLTTQAGLNSDAPGAISLESRTGTKMMKVKYDTHGKFSKTSSFLLSLSLAFLGVGVNGCGAGKSASGGNGGGTTSAVRGISGKVHGGQQPVSGATIQLYAVGSGSLDAASTPLIPTADQVVYTGPGTGALTDNDGNFTITGDFTCPTPSVQVYIIAKGGTSQGTPGSNLNNAIVLAAPLGDCATLVANAATTFVLINELSTVAMAYAWAPYMSGIANVGAIAVNDAGLINAVGNFNNLVNLSTGAAGGAALPSGAVVPTTELNTLADIIAVCVNSSSSNSSPCSTLQTDTGGADALSMSLGFAKNPSSSVLTALYSMVSSQGPFQPTLTSQPQDWTVAIKYSASSTLASPYDIAIDKVGNAWVSNSGGGIVVLTPNGGLGNTYSGSGIAGPRGLAIDRAGSLWVANPSANSVVKLTLSGVNVSAPSIYTAGGLNGPVAIAMDSGGNAWVANQLGNSVVELSSTGSALSGASGFTAGGNVNGPTGIALDKSGDVYVANSGGGNVVKLMNSTGAAATGSPFSDNALQGTSKVVLDSANNVFALGSTTGTSLVPAISQFSGTGSVAAYSPVTPTALAGFYPGIVALGGNRVLVSNSVAAGSLVLEMLGASPTSVSYGSLNTPIGIAVDLSGNVWVADSGDNTVCVFMGLVSPVATPIAANVGP